MNIISTIENICNPSRWGLPKEAVENLATRLRGIWLRFHNFFRPQQKDTSEHAYVYMRGLLTMDTERNYANIARRVNGIEDDGQNLQQFMSDSPWEVVPVFKQIQSEVSQRPELAGGILILDESGDKRAGTKSAGASRQYLGRLGKVDLGQVGVVLGYVVGSIWMMLDARIYLPKNWFTEPYRYRHQSLHIPDNCRFRTKKKLGLEMILSAQVPFEVVAFDSGYGDDHWFRIHLERAHLVYMAEIRTHIKVYLHRPVLAVPPTPATGHRGPRFSRRRVVSDERSIPVTEAIHHMQFQNVTVRHTERGLLEFSCAALRVWIVTKEGYLLEETLFVRVESDGIYKFALSNAPTDTPLEKLAYWQSARYFVERTIQDAKSEAGWDELTAGKYRAWMHHAALTALVLWFAAETKLDWKQLFPRDSSLASQMGVEVLPALSMSNIRELLKAALPLKQLSPSQARRLVVKHLISRTRSIRSRLKAHYARKSINTVLRI